MTTSLDSADRKILALLQEDASLSIAEIAKLTGLSQTPCWRRIKKLKQSGVIKKVSATIDSKAIGLDFVIYLMVKLINENNATFHQFESYIAESASVTHAEQIVGDYNYIMKIALKDVDAFNDFIVTNIYKSGLVRDAKPIITLKEVNLQTRRTEVLS